MLKVKFVRTRDGLFETVTSASTAEKRDAGTALLAGKFEANGTAARFFGVNNFAAKPADNEQISAGVVLAG